MNSKDKGNISEAFFLANMLQNECIVSKPFGDNARYDFIVDYNHKLFKFQVKYCDYKTENNSILCPCSSSTNHTTNKKLKSYKNDVDYMAFFLKEYNEIIIIPIEEIQDQQSITLRKTRTNNHQEKGVHYIEDYSLISFLKRENENII